VVDIRESAVRVSQKKIKNLGRGIRRSRTCWWAAMSGVDCGRVSDQQKPTVVSSGARAWSFPGCQALAVLVNMEATVGRQHTELARPLQLRGKTALLGIRRYEEWMSKRSYATKCYQ